jgi:5'-nucleotidase
MQIVSPPKRTAATLAALTTLATMLWAVGSPAQPAATVPLRIIAINDFHGHLEPGENAVQVPDPDESAGTVPLRSGGAAYLATRIRQLRAEAGHSVVVSAGDLIGASPLVSGLFYDEPTIEVMNEIGVDLNAVGNHELDRGVAELLRIAYGGCRSAVDDRLSCAAPNDRYDGARFPFLAANIEDRNGGALFAPSVVREVGGIRVGFIGAVTRSTPAIVKADGIAGLRFAAEAHAINAAATALRAQRVEALVAVVHEGGDADGGYDSCAAPRGPIFEIERQLDRSIDVVLSAHTHRGYNCRIGDRTVIQAASFGRLVAVVDLVLDRATGDVIADRTRARNVPVPNGLTRGARLTELYPALPPDPRVAAIVEHYRTRAAPIAGRSVGRIAETFDRNPSAGGDSALGRLIADAQLSATSREGAVVAFTNPGGMRSDLRFGTAAGLVTYADLYAVQPFGNALVTMTLTGAQLKQLLEQQWSARGSERARILQPSRGLTYAWSPARPAGDRVLADSLRLNGRRVESAQNYRVTVNDFLALGGDGFSVLREGTGAVGGPLDIDALTQFVRTESTQRPLVPDRNPRIRQGY